MAFTAPMTFVAGNVLTAAQMNTYVRDNMKAAAGADKAAARVFNSVLISVVNTTNTLLTYDSEQFDTQAMHSTVTNTGRLTVATGWGGQYECGASGNWGANFTGYRQLGLRINGTTQIIDDIVNPTAVAGYCSQSASALYVFVAGDYVDSFCSQSSGGNLNYNALASYAFFFWAIWQGTG